MQNLRARKGGGENKNGGIETLKKEKKKSFKIKYISLWVY